MSEPFEFEGDEVTDFTAQLPSTTLEAPAAYPRGTYLTLQVQVRVKSVRLEEDRKGNLTRKHVLALEECTITDVLTPAQRKALLEAAAAQLESEDSATVAGDYLVSEEQSPADAIDYEVMAAASADSPDPEVAIASPSVTQVTELRSYYDSTEQSDAIAGAEIVAATAEESFVPAASDAVARQVVSIDDDDLEHSWMDEDDDPTVHTVFDELPRRDLRYSSAGF